MNGIIVASYPNIKEEPMKKIYLIFSVFILSAMTGCFAAAPPFDINPVTPNLNIASTNVKPIRLAVVIQDPMAYTVFYQGQGGYKRDMTAEFRNRAFPLESNLSKISSDTFSQAFKQVVVLRELPQPGQYDAIVNINIGLILMKESVIVTGETSDVTAEWIMTVMDNQNREILNKKGVSPIHNFHWSVINPQSTTVIGMNETMSLILSELAKEWGTTLYALNLPNTAGVIP